MGRSTTSSPYKTMTRGQSGRSSTASGFQPPRDGSRHYAGWHVLREPRAHPRRSRSSTRLSSTEAPGLSPRAVPHVSLVRVDGEALGPSSSSTPTHADADRARRRVVASGRRVEVGNPNPEQFAVLVLEQLE